MQAIKRRSPQHSTVVAMFQRMARGARRKAAFAKTVAYYRSTGHAWTKAFA